jgi:hypothetical protein
MSKPTHQQVHIDVALTNISIAYNPGTFIAEQVFPAVPVGKISNRYFIYTKADWLRREADVRAPGTRAARGDYGLSTGQYVCVERAIAKGVPDEIADNADSPLQPDADAARWVTNQLMLEQENDVAGVAFGSSVWSASATPSTLWSNDTSDPLGDVETATNGIVSTIGQEANKGIMGRGLWRYVKNHPDIVDRIKGAAGPQSPAVVTLNAVAALFGIDRLLIGSAIADSAQEGATSSLSYIWGNHFLVAYVAGAPSLLNPSAGYVFTYGQRRIETFREDQEKQNVISGYQSWDTAAVAADAGYLIRSAA